MNFFDIFFSGIALSMDAVAVGMANGMSNPKMKKKQIFLIAIIFGGFQALMPLIGYFLAKVISSTSESFFQRISGWIAFVLLAFIGGKMIFDAIKEVVSAKKEKKKTDSVASSCEEKKC